MQHCKAESVQKQGLLEMEVALESLKYLYHS